MSLDAMRGHDLLPSVDVLRSLPKLYATEKTSTADKLIHLHFFVGSCDWWLAELDHDDLRLAFGFVNLGDSQCAEWGYFNLDELALVDVRHPLGLRLLVERDLHWLPTPFGQIKEART